jgi:hypothetical protein
MSPIAEMVGASTPQWAELAFWLETSDAILRGLGHGLNNRATALSATVESLDPRRAMGSAMTASLSRESQRLSEQVQDLRLLTFGRGAEAMPLLPGDVLHSAVRLHRFHASVGEVACYLEPSSEVPPVLARESALLHASLTQLTASKSFAGRGGVVRVVLSGTSDRAEVRFIADRAVDESGAMGQMPDPDASAPDPRALVLPARLAATQLAHADVQIAQDFGARRAVVQWVMPSLREMRRRQREA